MSFVTYILVAGLIMGTQDRYLLYFLAIGSHTFQHLNYVYFILISNLHISEKLHPSCEAKVGEN
jgi:hypothetical protein